MTTTTTTTTTIRRLLLLLQPSVQVLEPVLEQVLEPVPVPDLREHAGNVHCARWNTWSAKRATDQRLGAHQIGGGAFNTASLMMLISSIYAGCA